MSGVIVDLGQKINIEGFVKISIEKHPFFFTSYLVGSVCLAEILILTYIQLGYSLLGTSADQASTI